MTSLNSEKGGGIGLWCEALKVKHLPVGQQPWSITASFSTAACELSVVKRGAAWRNQAPVVVFPTLL